MFDYQKAFDQLAFEIADGGKILLCDAEKIAQDYITMGIANPHDIGFGRFIVERPIYLSKHEIRGNLQTLRNLGKA